MDTRIRNNTIFAITLLQLKSVFLTETDFTMYYISGSQLLLTDYPKTPYFGSLEK